MKLKEWSAFWLLGLVWGSSFLWIKIAIAFMGPLLVAALRLGIGLLGLLIVMAVVRQPFPRGRRTLLVRGARHAAIRGAVRLHRLGGVQDRFGVGGDPERHDAAVHDPDRPCLAAR
ncbi:MAG TPA: hypothetical protein VJT32_03615 [bacterium]|nr:hypothetical protein [bacterium]